MAGNGEGVNGGHDKALRDEIIESQKIQADFLKWKLISVAAVASASLRFGLAHPTSPAPAQVPSYSYAWCRLSACMSM